MEEEEKEVPPDENDQKLTESIITKKTKKVSVKFFLFIDKI